MVNNILSLDTFDIHPMNILMLKTIILKRDEMKTNMFVKGINERDNIKYLLQRDSAEIIYLLSKN